VHGSYEGEGCPGSGGCAWIGFGGECEPAQQCGVPLDFVYVGHLVDSAASIPFSGVDPSGMSRARIALTAWAPGPPSPSAGLRFRWNGGAWHERTLTAGEVRALSTDELDFIEGGIGLILEFPITDLSAGANTLEIEAVNVEGVGPPAVANVDLILD
jgi:hypothetical protein